jgi:hypothetical protein
MYYVPKVTKNVLNELVSYQNKITRWNLNPLDVDLSVLIQTRRLLGLSKKVGCTNWLELFTFKKRKL